MVTLAEIIPLDNFYARLHSQKLRGRYWDIFSLCNVLSFPGYTVFEKVFKAKLYQSTVNETELAEEFLNRPKEYAYGYYLLMLCFDAGKSYFTIQNMQFIVKIICVIVFSLIENNSVFHFFLAFGVDWLRSSFENPIALLRRGKVLLEIPLQRLPAFNSLFLSLLGLLGYD